MKSSGLVVETARLEDLPRLFEISSIIHRTNYTQLIPDDHVEEFSHRYESTQDNRERFVRRKMENISHLSYHFLKAVETDGTIVGYLSLRQEKDRAEIHSVFVHPAHQGKGAGSLLMQTAVQEFGNQPIELNVIVGNTAAISLYDKFGFQQVGLSDKTFYGSQLLHMRRPYAT